MEKERAAFPCVGTEDFRCFSVVAVSTAHFLKPQNCNGRTALHIAALISSNVNEIQEMLGGLSAQQLIEVLKIPDTTSQRATALHYAAMRKDSDIAMYILDHLTPEQKMMMLKVQDGQGCTPLHCVAREGRADVARSMLSYLMPAQRSELLEIVNEDNQTPIDVALQGNNGNGTVAGVFGDYRVTNKPMATSLLKFRDVQAEEEKKENHFGMEGCSVPRKTSLMVAQLMILFVISMTVAMDVIYIVSLQQRASLTMLELQGNIEILDKRTECSFNCQCGRDVVLLHLIAIFDGECARLCEDECPGLKYKDTSQTTTDEYEAFHDWGNVSTTTRSPGVYIVSSASHFSVMRSGGCRITADGVVKAAGLQILPRDVSTCLWICDEFTSVRTCDESISVWISNVPTSLRIYCYVITSARACAYVVRTSDVPTSLWICGATRKTLGWCDKRYDKLPGWSDKQHGGPDRHHGGPDRPREGESYRQREGVLLAT